MALRINPNFVHFINEKIILFVSGCNIVFYNLETKEQKFIQKNNSQRRITYLSIGEVKPEKNVFSFSKTTVKFQKRSSIFNFVENKEPKDILICICEYSDTENLFYITITKPYMDNVQYIIKSRENFWEINFATILSSSKYCVSLSKKYSNSKINPISTKLSFIKYTQEYFISEEIINEDINYCCYNPKNTIEIVLCGKGYLRLWNMFINEGSLKEHQQRFLKGRQEKEKNFIKAQFFDKKPFLLIVGTTENVFYIIDSFQVIFELNVCYSYENIYDLNAQNLGKVEESDDISDLKKTIDTLNINNLDIKLPYISSLCSSSPEIKMNSPRNKFDNLNDIYNKIKNQKIEILAKKKNDDVLERLYKTKREDDNNLKINKKCKVKFFELINDNLLFVIYEDDGCVLLYKIDWNKKNNKDNESQDNNESIENNNNNDSSIKKWKAVDCKIIRIAKNIKSVFTYSLYKKTNDIIMIVELEKKYKNKNQLNSIALYKLRKTIINEKIQNQHSLHFEYDLFDGFFELSPIKFIDFNEKKQNIFLIDINNTLNIFNILQNEYIIRHRFNEDIKSISVNQSNDLFAISFEKKVSIFIKLKQKIHNYSEVIVEDSIIKWTTNGDYLVIAGKSFAQGKENTYCIFFLDSDKFNTVNVIENIEYKITDLKMIDNDRYIFCLMSYSFICGIYLNMNIKSIALHELSNDSSESVSLNYFHLVFTHRPKNNYKYSCFDYDPFLKVLVTVDPINKKLFILSNYNKNDKENNIYTEVNNCNLTSIKIIKELNKLIGGDNKGCLLIYNWPLKGYEKNEVKNLNDNLISFISIDLGYISSILNFKNNSSLIALTCNSYVFVIDLLIKKYDDYKKFEYFQKSNKPQIEMFISPYIVYDIKTEEIERKEKNAIILEKSLEVLKINMDENKNNMQSLFNTELENMENNLKQNTNEQQQKYNIIEKEISMLTETMTQDFQSRLEEMKNHKLSLCNKYEEKIELYDNEISRLKVQLKDIKNSINEKYDSEADNQKTFYQNILNEYNQKFSKLEKETNQSLEKLVNLSCEYNEATESIEEDYKRLISNLDKKISETTEKNDKILKEKKQKLEEAKILEDIHKEKLEQKVKDSDKLIEKNVEIKQSIINATQRTITFQEQLLETEKNLSKIDKKLADLLIKNKHLEQIRFVLEHRMSALEKEKAPLEGRCLYLENQKNKLTNEFNKIILEINKNNQELENKQSQLRASLIQNYEIHDQKNYVQNKLTQLKNDLEQFLLSYQENEEISMKSIDNKATKVALNFKQFYDKYFSTPIEDELLNYQFYSQKLQDQTDKDGIANNFDLIMRNKAEEKLICEKEKVEELKVVKENGFKRIQNENTILITECNRLRKNLHEIYMHVIDIEQRFEQLTKINPKLSKNEIVGQIKQFIKLTHEKIKANYQKSRKNIKSPSIKNDKKMNKSRSCNKIISNNDFNKLVNEEYKKKIEKKEGEDTVRESATNRNKNTKNNPYMDVIKSKKGLKYQRNGSYLVHNKLLFQDKNNGNNKFNQLKKFGRTSGSGKFPLPLIQK